MTCKRIFVLLYLQGRSAYQPLVEPNGDRWIAYVGHHAGSAVNPL